MNTTKKLTLSLLLVLWAAAVNSAQQRADVPSSTPAPATTISTSDRGVRFASLGGVKQMRLEVFGEGGDSLYNSGFQAGNMRDWNLEDSRGQRLPDGSYLCVVTVRDLSGRLSVKQGSVQVHGGQASLQLSEAEQSGPAESSKRLAAVTGDAASAVTLMAHDGGEGQVVNTRGSLTFRAGDFFAGKDRELMRLTPEGSLGVGTRTPQATLDVAGTIRAAGGIRFADGTVQTTGLSGRTDAGGNVVLAATGVGTQHRLSKWTDSAGTLGDSTVYEDASGNIGVGTTAPAGVFDLRRGSAGDILQRFWNTGAGGATLRYVAGTGATSQIQFTDDAEWLMSIAGNNAVGMQFRVRESGSVNTPEQLASSARLTILRNGNVGVGITNPASKLDVAGNLHVSGSAVVDGNIAAKYQDVAEWVPARQQMAAGTVVILDATRTNAVTASKRMYDTHVAGVVSAQPGVILGEGGEGKVMVATTGRVKVRVDATRCPIRIGDLLVTSRKAGVAMRSLSIKVGGARIHRPGTIIGKALEPLASGEGEILVLLSLQ
jgi:hypothetical protein